jgi:hypothetical protein
MRRQAHQLGALGLAVLAAGLLAFLAGLAAGRAVQFATAPAVSGPPGAQLAPAHLTGGRR